MEAGIFHYLEECINISYKISQKYADEILVKQWSLWFLIMCGSVFLVSSEWNNFFTWNRSHWTVANLFSFYSFMNFSAD